MAMGTLNLEQEADVGPVQNQKQLEIIEAQVKDALDKGAQVLCGAKSLWTGLQLCPHYPRPL